MMPSALTSPADDAFAMLVSILDAGSLSTDDGPDLSESDTRSKLIDPLFKNVLGWRETDIKREEPVTEGFADYTFGAEYRWFHVEAKRDRPRFSLHAPSRARSLKISGPHLLENKSVKPVILQAAKYSPDIGTQFAVVTNGSQFIVFETTPHGRSWRDGYAIVFHDHEDIRNSFAEFYALLAREHVTSGSLHERFARAATATKQYYSPLSFVHNPDSEYVRNPFWSKISRAFSPLLIDQPDNEELQREIVRFCYVKTALGRESTKTLHHLLKDTMPKFVKDAGGIDLVEHGTGRESFRSFVLDDIKRNKPGAYILTGGVGSGKTSFLRHFATVDQDEFIRKFCVWLHIDFLPLAPSELAELRPTIEEYALRKIRGILEQRYPMFVPHTGDDFRDVFAEEIADLQVTRLYGVDQNDVKFRDTVNELVDELIGDDQRYLHGLIRNIRKQGRCVVFVLDNTDQLGESFQKDVFLFSQSLSDLYNALSIVSLREEKFFAAYRQGVFDAYGTRKFHIGSPALISVIKQRLNYGRLCYEQLAKEDGISDAEMKRTLRIIDALVTSSTERNGNIIRFLECVSAGDMRLALGMFGEFLSSGNTDVGKIEWITETQRDAYRMPFHEFAKSAILGSRKFFRGSVSRIVNLFSLSSAVSASHWTGCRMLARLKAAQYSQTAHGEGYVETRDIVREFRQAFGGADDCVEVCERLMAAGLVDSEPPRMQHLRDTEAIRITATGAYYWSFLVRSFAYLDLVLVDTAVDDEKLAHQLAEMSELKKEDYELGEFVDLRMERVAMFLEYLRNAESVEVAEVVRRGGVYNERLGDAIGNQIDKEVGEIRRRVRRRKGRW